MNSTVKSLIITIVAALAIPLGMQAQRVVLPAEMHSEATNRVAKIMLPDLSHRNAVLPMLDAVKEPTDVIDVPEAEIAADLLDYAHTFKGTRYRRGGKSPKGGFDCSGFTGYVFREFGYNLGASSRDQYRDGRAIEREEVRPGDLLFFNGRAAGGNRVGHVGIAVSVDDVTGDITFIHSATSRGVVVDKVSSPYFARRYVGARRVIGD